MQVCIWIIEMARRATFRTYEEHAAAPEQHCTCLGGRPALLQLVCQARLQAGRLPVLLHALAWLLPQCFRPHCLPAAYKLTHKQRSASRRIGGNMQRQASPILYRSMHQMLFASCGKGMCLLVDVNVENKSPSTRLQGMRKRKQSNACAPEP